MLAYQIGEDLKERIIPRAVDFFLGKNLGYEDEGSDGEFDEGSDDFVSLPFFFRPPFLVPSKHLH